MSLSNDQILEAIASKSLMEIMDLVKAMEEKFGVSAAARLLSLPVRPLPPPRWKSRPNYCAARRRR